MFSDLAGTRYDVSVQALFDVTAEGPAGIGGLPARLRLIRPFGRYQAGKAAAQR
jgi:hypothetical protein